MKTLEQIFQWDADQTDGDATGDITGPPPVEDGQAGNHMVPVSALLDERRKRQQAEARLGGHVDDDPGQDSAPPEGYPLGSLADDGPLAGYAPPDGAMDGGPADDLAMAQSEAAARGRHGDFDQALDAFERLVPLSPELAVSMQNAANPAEFAYQIGRQAMGEPVDHTALEHRIRADERERLMRAQRLAGLPRSLSDTQSAGSPGSAAEWAPKSLNEIFRPLGR